MILIFLIPDTFSIALLKAIALLMAIALLKAIAFLKGIAPLLAAEAKEEMEVDTSTTAI